MKIQITPSNGPEEHSPTKTSSEDQRTNKVFQKKSEPSQESSGIKGVWKKITTALGGGSTSKVFSTAINDGDTDDLTIEEAPVRGRLQAHGIVATDKTLILEERVEAAFNLRSLKKEITDGEDKKTYLAVKKKLDKEGFGGKVLNAAKHNSSEKGNHLRRVLSAEVVDFGKLLSRSSSLDRIEAEAVKALEKKEHDEALPKHRAIESRKKGSIEKKTKEREDIQKGIAFAKQQLALAIHPENNPSKQERFHSAIENLEVDLQEINGKIADLETSLKGTKAEIQKREKVHESKAQKLADQVYFELEQLDETQTSLFIDYIKREEDSIQEEKEVKDLLKFLRWSKNKVGRQPLFPKNVIFTIVASKLFHGFLEKKVSLALASPLRH